MSINKEEVAFDRGSRLYPGVVYLGPRHRSAGCPWCNLHVVVAECGHDPCWAFSTPRKEIRFRKKCGSTL